MAWPLIGERTVMPCLAEKTASATPQWLSRSRVSVARSCTVACLFIVVLLTRLRKAVPVSRDAEEP